MAQPLISTVPWGELLKRTARESLDDDCLGIAAQLAYYFFLALSPAILFLLALASFFPLGNLTVEVARLLAPFVSGEVLTLIQGEMMRLGDNDNAGLLTVGALIAMWSSSAATVSIVGSVNKAYDLIKTRPWWKVRLIAIALTSALALLVLTALTLLLTGPALATYVGRSVGLGDALEWALRMMQWPVAVAAVVTALGLVYHFAPDHSRPWTWVSPGAVLATVLWLVASLGFKWYVAKVGDYQASYGAIGGVMVLLLWFYVSGLALLVGAELNSEIAHAAGPATVRSASGHESAGALEVIAHPTPAQLPGTAGPSVVGRAAGTVLIVLVVGQSWWQGGHGRRGRHG